MSERDHTAPPSNAAPTYEHSDVETRSLRAFLIGLAIALAIVAAAVFGFFELLHHQAKTADRPPPPFERADERPAGPLLQTSPRADLRELRKREDEHLTSYAWVDREQGRVRIPIDRAIGIVAERGFPTWPTTESKPQTAQPQPGDRKESDQSDRRASPSEIPLNRPQSQNQP